MYTMGQVIRMDHSGSEEISAAHNQRQLTLEEIALYLKVSAKTVLRLIESDDLPGAKVSSEWRSTKAAIDDWLTARMEKSPDDALVRVLQTKNRLQPIPRLITADRILMNMTPAEKPLLLKQLAQPLYDAGIVEDLDAYLEMLSDRESMVSTAIGGGVAVPHAHVAEDTGVRENSIVLGICPAGTDFDAIDGTPTRLMLLVAAISTEAHLRLMAKIMLMLRVPGVREELVKAQTKEEVAALIMRTHEDLSYRL